MKVAGFGFRAGAGIESLAAALQAAGGAVGVAKFATVDAKAGEPGIAGLAERLSLPVEPVAAAALRFAVVETQSEASMKRYGTGSVAEAAALIAAGPGARLLGPRVVSADGMAACALAEALGE